MALFPADSNVLALAIRCKIIYRCRLIPICFRHNRPKWERLIKNFFSRLAKERSSCRLSLMYLKTLVRISGSFPFSPSSFLSLSGFVIRIANHPPSSAAVGNRLRTVNIPRPPLIVIYPTRRLSPVPLTAIIPRAISQQKSSQHQRSRKKPDLWSQNAQTPLLSSCILLLEY